MKDNTVSQTAYTVLQGVVLTGRQPETRALVSDARMAACLTLLNSTEEGRKRLRQLGNPVAMAGLKLMQRLLMPGIALHYLTRKQAIETLIRSQIVEGAQQIVNIGAGFDTLTYELSRSDPDRVCIELDHPATADPKRRALAPTAPDNLHFQAIDLSQAPLQEALASIPAFDPDLSTCFIAEGVLMYLTPAQVEGVFAALRRAVSGEVYCVFTATPPLDSPGTNASWLLKRYLHRLGEPLQWALEASQIEAFLRHQGYDLDQIITGADMRQTYLPPDLKGPFHRGEYVVSCTSKARG